MTFDVKGGKGAAIDVKRKTGWDPDWYPFWEAWEFTKGGKIWVNRTLSARHNADTFSTPDFGSETKGTVKIEGEVKALPGYALPANMKPTNKIPTGNLPVTRTEPPDWSASAKGAAHNLTVEWNCCPKGTRTKATTVTTTP